MLHTRFLKLARILGGDFVHEHTAICVSDVEEATALYQQLGYKSIGPTNGPARFMENPDQNTRVEIMPSSDPDRVPHEAIAFKTEAEYREAVKILTEHQEITQCREHKTEGFKYIMYSHTWNDKIYYLQVLWRKEWFFTGLWN